MSNWRMTIIIGFRVRHFNHLLPTIECLHLVISFHTLARTPLSIWCGIWRKRLEGICVGKWNIRWYRCWQSSKWWSYMDSWLPVTAFTKIFEGALKNARETLRNWVHLAHASPRSWLLESRSCEEGTARRGSCQWCDWITHRRIQAELHQYLL